MSSTHTGRVPSDHERPSSPMDSSGEAPKGSGANPGSSIANNNNLADAYKCNGFEDIGKCFMKLHLQISGVQADVECLKTKVSNLEQFAEHSNESIRTIHEETIPNIEDKIAAVDNERVKLDMWGRKWNLIIRGVKGDSKENPRNTEKVVREFLITTLKMEESFSKTVLLTAVHRLQGGSEGCPNIIIRLSSLLDRVDIMNAAYKLKRGSGFSVIPDLPNVVSKRRSSLLEKRWKMPPRERNNYKLIYRKDHPFVELVEKRHR